MRPPGARILRAGASSSRRPEGPPAPPCRRREPEAGSAGPRAGPRRRGRAGAEYRDGAGSCPVAVHGASRSTMSAGAGGLHSSASASTISASRRSLARFSPSRRRREAERSTATTRAPAAASCAVFPPGAAPISSTRLPATTGRGSGQAEPPPHLAPTTPPSRSPRAASPRQRRAAEACRRADAAHRARRATPRCGLPLPRPARGRAAARPDGPRRWLGSALRRRLRPS